MRSILFLLLIQINLVFCGTIIETKLGYVQGAVMLSRGGRRFDAFLGIPYAKPPVGKLRFQDPLIYDTAWNGTFDATRYPPVCPQLNGSNVFIGQEDCLYLNIYVPQVKTKEKLPVWVFIYGGRRLSGNASPNKHGPHYIMDKPVVFVTMTYRINILGFLSTEDGVIPGNFGLKDELIVLKWIQQHINAFGGDSTNVTLSGGSTGGIDAALHLCSPLSKGLFHRAISQSGHPLTTVMKPGLARKQAWMLASMVGCEHSKTTEHLLSCLQGIPVHKIIQSLLRTEYRSSPMAKFAPVVESADSPMRFLVDEPLNELRKSHSIPWMLGINSDEGSVGVIGFYTTPKSIDNFVNNIHATLPDLLGYKHFTNKTIITDLILKKYFNETSIKESFKQMSRVSGTVHFFIGVIDSALQYNGIKYFYVYDHQNAINYERNYYLRGLHGQGKMGELKIQIGVCHGEELRSLQHYPSLFPPIIDGKDKLVSDQVISLWYNFVVYGNPNGNNSINIWQPVTSSKLEYLHIHDLKLEMKNKPFWDDYLFYKEVLGI